MPGEEEAGRLRGPAPCGVLCVLSAILLVVGGWVAGLETTTARAAEPAAPVLVVTQMPAETPAAPDERAADSGASAPDWPVAGDGARLVLITPDAPPRVLTEGFRGAVDPEVSFDGKRLLFAGKRSATDRWNIYEMDLAGGEPRRITADMGDCRQPVYVGRFFTIDSPEPWRRIAFVSNATGENDDSSGTPSTSLYGCNLDGSGVQRLTYNPASDMEPATLPDGRLVYSGRQSASPERGLSGRTSLFTAQIDGLDHALFSGDEGEPNKRMPAVTEGRLVAFIEPQPGTPDRAGALAAVSLRRNLHSYRQLRDGKSALYHSPAPLADGALLVSRRPVDGSGTHAVVRLDPTTDEEQVLFDDPAWHDVQARAVMARPRPDGRSSVLDESKPTGRLYALDVYDSDLVATNRGWVRPGTPLRLRVVEGLPRPVTDSTTSAVTDKEPQNTPTLLRRRVLGEVSVETDGSFNLEVPANVPLQLQLVDAEGLAIRSCEWIWVRNNENRGCIGCHEDGERTPENRFVQALRKPSIPLATSGDSRRAVDFRHDVFPIIAARCAVGACHGAGANAPALELNGGRVSGSAAAGEPLDVMIRVYDALLESWPEPPRGATCAGRFVHPGRARTSPLVWHVSGWNMSRPWDGMATMGAIPLMPPEAETPLTADEIRTLIEWVDLGAAWSHDALAVDSGTRQAGRDHPARPADDDETGGAPIGDAGSTSGGGTR